MTGRSNSDWEKATGGSKEDFIEEYGQEAADNIDWEKELTDAEKEEKEARSREQEHLENIERLRR